MSSPLQLDLFQATGNLPDEELSPKLAPPKLAPPPPEPRRTSKEEASTREPSVTTETPAVPKVSAPTASELRDGFAARLRSLMPLAAVTLTNNRSSIISARQAAGRFDLRIHRCFAGAPDDILAAVATFLQSPKRSTARRDALATIRQFFHQHGPAESQQRPRRQLVLRPVGETLDLRNLRDEINRQYFDNQLSVDITWGRATARRRRRRGCGFSVRLGTYTDRDLLVRIHRCLDHSSVPQYVVEAVVYHEMLHAAVPPVVKNGRRHVHTAEFRRRERLFRDHDRAERWIDRNLGRLIGVR